MNKFTLITLIAIFVFASSKKTNQHIYDLETIPSEYTKEYPIGTYLNVWFRAIDRNGLEWILSEDNIFENAFLERKFVDRKKNKLGAYVFELANAGVQDIKFDLFSNGEYLESKIIHLVISGKESAFLQ